MEETRWARKACEDTGRNPIHYTRNFETPTEVIMKMIDVGGLEFLMILSRGKIRGVLGILMLVIHCIGH